MRPHSAVLLTTLLMSACHAPEVHRFDMFDVVDAGISKSPEAGVAAPVALAPEDFAMWGVDVSHHQGRIDWRQVATYPRVRFAYIKATEGGSHVDRRFRENWNGARAAGLKVGAYHYFSFCRSGADQARNFLSVVPQSRDALPPVVDVEFVGNCTQTPDIEKVRQEVTTFLDTVEQERGVQSLLYVVDPAFDVFVRRMAKKRRLWVRGDGLKTVNGSGFEWSLWQFTDSARVPGIMNAVDMNAFAPDFVANDMREHQ